MRSFRKRVCRDLRESLHDEIFLTNSANRKIVSKLKVKVVLKVSRVQEVLDCNCDDCQNHKFSIADDAAVCVSQLAEWIRLFGPILFALITYIGCPQLIAAFFKHDYTDGKIALDLANFTSENILTKFWQPFAKVEPRAAKFLADQVADQKHCFFVPILNDHLRQASELQIFDTDVLIPLSHDEKIDAGGFGKVYKIQIFPEYQDFTTIPSHLELVRKEVDLTKPGYHHEELYNLLLIKRLEDEVNITRLISAYKHGNYLNFIFRRARTNLYAYTRPEDDGSRVWISNILSHPLWKQMLAIVRAVRRLHTDVYMTESSSQFRVYHFDLKPDNILVDFSENQLKLLLTDFGLAKVQALMHNVKTSGMMAWGGTQTYAPPESISGKNWRNHRYDIWALGCILLEVCTFIVQGPEAVTRLDADREMEEPEGSGLSHDWYWCRPDGINAQIKPAVRTWMKNIQLSADVHGKVTSNFVASILELVGKMLNIDQSQRPDAEEAQVELSTAIELATNALSKRTVWRQSPFAASESELNASSEESTVVTTTELCHLQHVVCKYGRYRYDDPAMVRLYIDELGVLRLEIWSNSVVSYEVNLENKSNMAVSPSPGVDKCSIVRLHVPENGDASQKEFIVYLTKPREAVIFQTALLGLSPRSFTTANQKSLKIIGLCVENYHSTMRKLLQRKSEVNKHQNWGASRALQIWSDHVTFCDKSSYDYELSRTSTGRLIRHSCGHKIVIFCENAILMMPFAKNVRLEKPGDKHSGMRHRFVPTDAGRGSRQPSFNVYEMVCHDAHRHLLPLDREAFSRIEHQSAFDCAVLEIEFASRRDCDSFTKVYLALKKKWMDEVETIRVGNMNAGEELGWQAAIYS